MNSQQLCVFTTILLAVVTMLYIKASELILLITLYPSTYITLFPPLLNSYCILCLMNWSCWSLTPLHSLKMYILFLFKSVAVSQL